MQVLSQYFYKIINYIMLKKLGYTIAVLDSGIGGISVLRQLIKNGGNYIYFADNEFMPYGKRSNRELSKRLDDIVSLLRERYQVDKIVIACNTASTILKDKYDDVVTMRFVKDKTYFATKLSKKNLKGYNVIADSTLAHQIEKNIFNSKKLDLIIKKHVYRHHLNELNEYILGCTHYELVADIFRKYCPNTKIWCNSEFVINDITQEKTNNTNVYFITTKQSKEYNEVLEQLIRKGEK